MDLIDPGNTGLGHRQVQRWGLPDGWVISARPAHPALVSEEDFIAAQGIRAEREGNDPGREYLLAGLLRCGICGRRAESCWSSNRPAYRCRPGAPHDLVRPDPVRGQQHDPGPLGSPARIDGDRTHEASTSRSRGGTSTFTVNGMNHGLRTIIRGQGSSLTEH